MTKKLKRIHETSRGGRRQVLIKNRHIRTICERVSVETGYPFQWCFDELMEMFADQHVLGLNSQDALFKRVVEKLEL